MQADAEAWAEEGCQITWVRFLRVWMIHDDSYQDHPVWVSWLDYPTLHTIQTGYPLEVL